MVSEHSPWPGPRRQHGLKARSWLTQKKEYGIEAVDDIEIKRVVEKSTDTIVITETSGRIAIVKIPQENDSPVQHSVVTEKQDNEKLEAIDLSSETIRNEGFDGVATTSSTVIEERKDISRQIGTCDLGYCNVGFDWPHFQEGITVTLSEPADLIGKATLTEVIGGLVAIKKGVLLGGAVGVLVATILGLGTGRDWTITEYDLDGWTFNRISAGVANSWDADPSSHQTAVQSRGRHIYECHEGPPN